MLQPTDLQIVTNVSEKPSVSS